MSGIRKHKEREALRSWDQFRKDFESSGEIDLLETPEQQRKRIARLEADPFEWFKYYFPKVCKSDFAPWHRKAVPYIIQHWEAYFTGKICRDFAKSSILSMTLLFLYFKKEFRMLGYVSYTSDQAERLLSPVKAALDFNEKLRHDYGNRVGLVDWTGAYFKTNDGVIFRALGAGQSPRGGKTDDGDRYDIFVFDDIDDEETCRNPERLDNRWKWIEGACFGALHISGKRRLIFINNKIDEDSIIQRAEDHAKTIKQDLTTKPLCMTVNLTDKRGNSNWPSAYTKEQCKAMVALLGAEADTEYYNDPKLRGKEFKKEWFVFKRLPPLSSYKYILSYHDGGFKNTKTSDTKALILIGMKNQEYHIHKVYCGPTSMNGAAEWHYDLNEFLQGKGTTCPMYMEEVFLLDLMYDTFDRVAKTKGFRIPIQGDTRKKPDKDIRIAASAGHFERANVYFDERLRHDRHTHQLIEQYLKFRVGARSKKDGPDAVEGGMFLLRNMISFSPEMMTTFHSGSNKYKLA